MSGDIVERLQQVARANGCEAGRGCSEAAAEIERLRAERDAERALADQLARALLDGPFRGDRRDRMYGSGWADVHDALDAWQEARRG